MRRKAATYTLDELIITRISSSNISQYNKLALTTFFSSMEKFSKRLEEESRPNGNKSVEKFNHAWGQLQASVLIANAEGLGYLVRQINNTHLKTNLGTLRFAQFILLFESNLIAPTIGADAILSNFKDWTVGLDDWKMKTYSKQTDKQAAEVSDFLERLNAWVDGLSAMANPEGKKVGAEIVKILEKLGYKDGTWDIKDPIIIEKIHKEINKDSLESEFKSTLVKLIDSLESGTYYPQADAGILIVAGHTIREALDDIQVKLLKVKVAQDEGASHDQARVSSTQQQSASRSSVQHDPRRVSPTESLSSSAPVSRSKLEHDPTKISKADVIEPVHHKPVSPGK